MGPFRILISATCAALLSSVVFCPAQSQPLIQREKRIALVIGNSAYRHVPALTNPVNDARLVAETLGGLGFTLVGGSVYLDLEKAAFDAAVQTFGTELRGAEVGLFYYAGHGLQVRGVNYLVPIGANPTREADVDFQMLDTNVVLRQMEGSGTRLNLVILDACRNNPFGDRSLRSAGRGLAQMQAPEGTLISFATQPGNIALDGLGRNSPFTEALTATIRKPGLGLFDTFNAVGLAVKSSTAGAQQPWLSSSPIVGSFYFAGRPAGVDTATTGSQSAPPIAADEVFWLAIRDSKLQALFEEFLSKFPLSPRAVEARARLEEIKKTQIAVANFPDNAKSATAAPASFEAVKRALSKDVPINDTLLRTVVNNPLFSGAPAIRIARYRNDDGGKNEWSTDCKVRNLGGHLSQHDCAETTKGATKITTTILAANGLVDLGWRERFTGGQQNVVKRIENLSGRIFPVALGNKFKYRAVTTSPRGVDDLIREYTCEVTERRRASEFHVGVTGEAFVVACQQQTTWPKQNVQNTQEELQVFFQELGAALPVDTIAPTQVRPSSYVGTFLKDFEFAR